ncbi:hypothetical protein HanIR_Chr02g0063661 [Helianthus annuus]|nr:hypothetical protein HanIR_Chr02g0063661 [Helianthus annuus]
MISYFWSPKLVLEMIRGMPLRILERLDLLEPFNKTKCFYKVVLFDPFNKILELCNSHKMLK